MIFYNRPAILFNDYLHNYSFPRYISMEFDDLTAWRIFKYYLVYEDLNANPTQNLTITKVFSILDKLKLFEGLRKPNLYKSIEKASKITESMKKTKMKIFFMITLNKKTCILQNRNLSSTLYLLTFLSNLVY